MELDTDIWHGIYIYICPYNERNWYAASDMMHWDVNDCTDVVFLSTCLPAWNHEETDSVSFRCYETANLVSLNVNVSVIEGKQKVEEMLRFKQIYYVMLLKENHRKSILEDNYRNLNVDCMS